MPTTHERHRNNVKAGVFVTISILLALFVVATLKNLWRVIFEATDAYAITFSVEAGVQSLSQDSIVRVGGINMGTVKRVQLRELLEDGIPPQTDGGPAGSFHTIVVFIEIDDRVPLYSNAIAFVKGPLIGAEAWIEISDIGHAGDLDQDGQPDGVRLRPNEVGEPTNWLKGTDAGTLLAQFLGPKGARRAEEIMENLVVVSGEVRADWNEYVRPTLASARDGVADFREIVARIDQDWPRWATNVDEILVKVLSASENLDLAMEEGRVLIDSARSGVGEIRAMIESNRPGVDEFIANLQSASADVRAVADDIANNLAGKVEALLDRGREGIDAFSSTATKLQQEVDVLSPSIRDTLANLNLASNELALATAEIRASPWRLLYRPSTEELEYENLSLAASNFTIAAAQLKVAAQAVERALANWPDPAEAPERLRALEAMLQETMQRYSEAQEKLLSILSQSGNGQ